MLSTLKVVTEVIGLLVASDLKGLQALGSLPATKCLEMVIRLQKSVLWLAYIGAQLDICPTSDG